MKREELREMGISDENIEKIMADLGKNKQSSLKAEQLQDAYDKAVANAAELQKQLDAINEKNMSDIEKANKATETEKTKVASLEAEIAKMRQKQNLAELGITGELAETLFDDKGNLNYEALGKIISGREEAAANAKVQEIASKTTNPGGGSGNTTPEKTEAEQVAISIGKSLSGNAKTTADIIANYK